MRYTKPEITIAFEKLQSLLKPGMTIHTVSRHTSRSGMQRSISMFAFLPGDNAPTELDYWVSRVLGESIDQKHGGVRIGGCGMDMGFHLVYALARRLYPDGFGCTGPGDGYATSCPSNNHSNGDRDYTPHGAMTYNGVSVPAFQHWHSDGGYAFRHRWM